MLFWKSPHVHLTHAKKPSILALFSDSLLGDVRIRPYLNALIARGVISNYDVVDRSMRLLGPRKSSQFTHIWCQRNVSTAQMRFLKRHARANIIYDFDDLLTAVPTFVMKTRRRTLKAIYWCLRHARAVTVASGHMGTYLCEDIPDIAAKVVILQNGCAEAGVPRRERKKQLIWASSDIPFFMRENPDFVSKLAALTNRLGYETILIGRFQDVPTALFDRCRVIPHLDFVSYRELLRYFNGALGLAPLPTEFHGVAQRYFDAKSDIKLVDFLSSRIIPILSTAIPYVKSDLYLPMLAGVDGDELLGKIEMCIADYDRISDYVDKTIHAGGVLRSRTFLEISKALDHLFQ